MSEIYLTRLLATKFTLQQYVDDLFRSILRADTKQTRCIKWLFDFFDDSASSHDISDPQVVHTWKSNSLLLRFWVNILKNPEFVFDIHKPPIVDSCLSVITQTFMDSCSTHDQKLSKDSPSSKLLFAKDIPRYRKMVFEFYNEIRNLPRTPEDDLLNILALKSQQRACDLSGRDSLQQLYNYAAQYRIELLESLDDDPTARRLNLASQFETIHSFVQRDQIFC